MLKNQWAGCISLATAGSCFHCSRLLSLADLEESYSPTHQIDQHRLSWGSRCQRPGDVKQRPNGVNLPFTNNRQLLHLCGLSTETAEKRRVLPKVSDVRAAQRTPSFPPQRHVLGRAGFKRGNRHIISGVWAGNSIYLPVTSQQVSTVPPSAERALLVSPKTGLHGGRRPTETDPSKRRPTPPDLQSKSLPRDTYKAKAYTARPTKQKPTPRHLQSKDLRRQTYKAKAYPETPTERRPTKPDLQSKSLPRDTYKAKTYTARPTKQKPTIRHLQSEGLHSQIYKAKAYPETPTEPRPTPPNLKTKAYPETPTERRPTPPNLQSKSPPRDSYRAKTYTAKPTEQKPTKTRHGAT